MFSGLSQFLVGKGFTVRDVTRESRVRDVKNDLALSQCCVPVGVLLCVHRFACVKS